jgi:hypothetical protein
LTPTIPIEIMAKFPKAANHLQMNSERERERRLQDQNCSEKIVTKTLT